MKKKNLKPETKLARYIAAALLTSVCFGVNAPAYAADLPSFFDWRLTNPTDRNSGKDSLSIVPSVKNQGSVGTCWAFASLGSYGIKLDDSAESCQGRWGKCNRGHA